MANKNLGKELALAPEGAEDADVQNEILDNAEANEAFQNEAVLDAVHAGMALELALQIYGNR